MKVKHLIKELQKTDPELEVVLESGFYEKNHGLRFFDGNTIMIGQRCDDKICIRSHVIHPHPNKKHDFDKYNNCDDTPRPFNEK